MQSHGAEDLDGLRKVYGPRWAWSLKEEILMMRFDECFPSQRAVEQSRAVEDPKWHAMVEAAKALDSNKVRVRREDV